MTKKNNIKTLVSRAKNGDKSAFEALYNEYKDKVYFFALRYVNSTRIAEDMTSETFVTALENISRIREDEAFAGWLYTICYNKCIARLKAQNKLEYFDDEEELSLDSPVMLPEDYAENNDIKCKLREMIDSLEPSQRSAIILFYYEDMSLKEIAAALGINENSAGVRLHRARKHIKKQLEKLYGKSGMLMAFPLSAMLENTAQEGYVVIKKAARVAKTSLFTKAAIGAAAAAVAVTIGLGYLNNEMGDERLPKPASQKTVITWAVPHEYSISDENIKALNTELDKRGTGIEVDFKWYGGDYDKALTDHRDSIDIASLGFDSEDFSSLEVINRGFFEPINTDSTLYDTYSKKLWTQTNVNGVSYTVPNTAIGEGEIKYIFNNNYFSKEQIEGFDLDFSSLGNMMNELDNKEKMICLASAEQLITTDGSLCRNGFIYSASEKKAFDYSDSPELKKVLDTLHSYYEQGYIFDPTGKLESEADKIGSGNFAVIITYEGAELPIITVPVTERTTTPYIYSRTACTTGISSGSRNKSDALKLLTLVNTDNEILKYFVLDSFDNNTSINKNSELIIGSKAFSDKAEIKEYFDTKTLSSPFNGFNMDADFSSLGDNSIFDIWSETDYPALFDRLKSNKTENKADKINASLERFFAGRE